MKTAITLFLLWSGLAQAQTIYSWSGLGSDNNMTTSQNFSSVPNGDDILLFNNNIRTTPINNLSQTNRHQIIFGNNAGSFVLNGSVNNAFDYHSPNFPKIENNSAFEQIINFPISIAYNKMEFNAIGADLIFGGVINNSGRDLFVAGNTDKTVTFLNGISGSGKLVLSHNSNVNLNTTVCTYTGNTELNTGKLTTSVTLSCLNFLISGGTFETSNANIISNSANVILSSGTLIIGDNETINDLTVYGGTIQIAAGKTLTILGKLKISGTYSFAGTGSILYGSSASLEYGCGCSLNSTSNEWPTLSAPTTILASGTNLTLHESRSIFGNLTLYGILYTTSSQLITFEDGSTATGGSNTAFISGPVKKTGDNLFIFPSGKDGKWARIGISNPSSTTDSYIAEYFKSGYSNLDVQSPITNVSTVEYWTLTRATGTSMLNVTIYYEDGSFSGINTTPATSNTILSVYNNSSSKWVDCGGVKNVSGNPTSGNVTMNGINSFTYFTFGCLDNSQPLPVSISKISATELGNSNVIKWTTVNEINNDYFLIERSSDNGKLYETIGQVKGSGNSLIAINYSFIDKNPVRGELNFYQLVQYDFNGVSEIFGPVKVKTGNSLIIDASPNPFSDFLTIKIPDNDNDALIRICNSYGDVIYENQIVENSEMISISTESWSQGSYYLTITGKYNKLTSKILKL